MSDLNAAQIRGLFDELKGANSARNAEYDRARRRYRGEHWDDETNPAPVGRYSLTANYLRPAVRQAVRDLFSRTPGVQVLPRGADDRARRIAEGAEGVIYRCWEENEAIKAFRRAAHNQVLLRRGLLYYWWDKDRKMVRFRSVAPENWYPVYDGEDVVECLFVSRRLTRELRRLHPNAEIQSDLGRDVAGGGAGVSHVDGGVTDALGDLGSAADPARQTLSGYSTVLDYFDRGGRWVRLVGDQVISDVRLGYETGEVPFIEVPNDLPGDEQEPESEVPEDIVELNQYLDRLISQQADIIHRYANPTIIDQGSGQSPAEVRRTVQGDGAVLPIRKDGQIRFLNWDGPQPAISDQREAIKSMIHDLTGRPAVAFGEAVTNQSGVMTNLAMNPTVSTAQDRQTLWGLSLSRLNRAILRLFERFAPTEDLSYQGYRPTGLSMSRMEYFETSDFKGRDIGGWYRNQLKWPSVLRTDDPIYVQNIISQVTSDPPLLSVYDAIEALGHDDAEGMADRIAAQLEDPRFHPDRLSGAISAATALGGAQIPPDLEGLLPGGGAMAGGDSVGAAGAAGNPNRDMLSKIV